MKFPPDDLPEDPTASSAWYWSIIFARDGKYKMLRQRIRDGIATQGELDLNAEILAELEAKGRVKTPKAKATEAVWRDSVALMVLATEEWLRRQGRTNGIRKLIAATRLANSRGAKAIGNAVRAFEKDANNRAFAQQFIDGFDGPDVEVEVNKLPPESST